MIKKAIIFLSFLILTVTNSNISAQTLLWSSSSDLSATGNSADSPQISLSSDGSKATAVWSRDNGLNFIIQSASATIVDGIATWGATIDLSATGSSAGSPQISLSSDGSKATAVWMLYNGSNFIIQSASATIVDGIATWGATSDLSATGNSASSPQISLSSDGSKATAVWYRYNGSNDIIQSASATIVDGIATWGATIDLSATGSSAGSPQISLSSDGSKATAVWSRYNGSNDIIQSASATIVDGIATWGATSDLSATGGSAFSPQISLSSDGSKATAVWYRYNGLNFIIQSASATIVDGIATWGATSDLSATGSGASSSQISLSSDGSKATAVWSRYNGSNFIIQSASATIVDGIATWGAGSDLSATGNSASSPQISLSSDGSKATAVWYRYNGLNDIIQSASATIVDGIATWGTTSDLSATGNSASSPQISLSSDGSKATAVWYRYNGSNGIIQSASALEDQCVNDANKTQPGVCGCGVVDTDTDLDGTADCNDACPNDPSKDAPGACGCGVVDTDTDLDGTADCNDACPNDPSKDAPGACGCGVVDTDTDLDGTADCNDACTNDPSKDAPGACGCGVVDTDTDLDGTADCNETKGCLFKAQVLRVIKNLKTKVSIDQVGTSFGTRILTKKIMSLNDASLLSQAKRLERVARKVKEALVNGDQSNFTSFRKKALFKARKLRDRLCEA